MPNPFRNCLGCGQVDDHPRHIIDVGGTDTYWHHDCHARATGDPYSAAVAECGLTGDELRAHIQEHDPAGAVDAPAES
jgi:hypothetical protein